MAWGRGHDQSADHPERMQLVFTTQLHHQLQAVARAPPNATAVTTTDEHRPAAPPPPPPPVDGWELEKKVGALRELRPLLERPHFIYADCGGHRAAPDGTTPTSSRRGLFTMDAYFNKTLPLATGQWALLELWSFLLDTSERLTPSRHRSRGLFVHLAACVCRRVEFIAGSRIDDDPVTVDDRVHERYHWLLERALDLCATKFAYPSRVLLEDNAKFAAHVLTTVCFRFPSRAGRVLDAVVECTRVLEEHPRRPHRPSRTPHAGPTTASQKLPEQPEQKQPQPSQGTRSPRECRRHWHSLLPPETTSAVDVALRRPDERDKAILAAFAAYKVARRRSTTPTVPSPSRLQRRTVESTLQRALESTMDEPGSLTPAEVAFIQETPILHALERLEPALLLGRRQLRDAVDRTVGAFVERLVRPARDDLLVVDFVGAYLEDVTLWCAAAAGGRTGPKAPPLLWHCIPGYFCVVRAIVAVFQRMCQRRPRVTTTSAATVGNILALASDASPDLWLPYWTNREVNAVMEVLRPVLVNERLVDVFVEIALEGTNILDPSSVNYSLSVLQRVLEIGAASARRLPLTTTTTTTSSASGSSSGSRRPRGLLPEAFDDGYFCGALRTALQSSHVQILLKALTFLYNCLDLLPPPARRRLVSDLVLRENFFRMFLHWNEEIRKLYSYVLVFKVFASNRLDLPLAADRILLARSPFFELTAAAAAGHHAHPLVGPTPPSFGYWSHLSDIAHSMLKANSAEVREEQRRTAAATALGRLVHWDLSARLQRPPRREWLFRASLDDDDISVDLLVASKLDASLKMVADQIAGGATARRYFPVEQEAYAERAMAQYVLVLWEYYAEAFEHPAAPPMAPKLEFTISSPFAAE